MSHRLLEGSGRVADALLDLWAEVRETPALRKAVAAVALLGLVAYMAAGVKGLLVLGLVLALAAAYRPLRQRFKRWYLLNQ